MTRWFRLQTRAALAALVSLTTAACGGAGSGSEHFSVDTLESGTIVIHNSAASLWGPEDAWTAVEQVRIGSRDAADPDELGRIYVLDRQPREVRVFAPTGEHIRTLGGAGQGPGEFVNPIGMDWGPEGNLWVVDVRNARYSVFDTAGNFLDSYPRQIGGWSYNWGGGFDRAGRLYEPSFFRSAALGGTQRVYIGHSVAGGIVATDTFELPYHDVSASSFRINTQSGSSIVGIPFSTQFAWRFDGADGIWFAANDGYRLYHRRLAGDTVRILERDYDPLPVGNDDREAVRDRFTRFGEQVTNEIIARIPDVKPAFESFVVDDQGYVWVMQTSATEQDLSVRGIRFDVFDPEGRYLGAVQTDVGRMPAPRIIGNQLVGVTRDEYDTPYVVLYHIEERS